MLNRADVVQKIIHKNGYKRYLEIGVNKRRTFNAIKIDHKIGIDPKKVATYTMASDVFFNIYKGLIFDVVFVDGNHNGDYVYRDVVNSIKILDQKKGTIIMHDCKPGNELTQVRSNHPERKHKKVVAWNGTVWRAWLALRSLQHLNVNMYVVDTDEGVGVIEFGKKRLQPYIDRCCCLMEYVDFRKRQNELLNLVSVEMFLDRV